MAARSGQGRRSRPDSFTTRPAKPQIDDVDHGRQHRRRRRHDADEDVDQPSHGDAIGAGLRGGRAGLWVDGQHAFEPAPQRRAEAVFVEAERRDGSDHDQRADDRGPQCEAADRVPVQSFAAIGQWPREQGQVAEPPGRQSDPEQESGEEEAPRAPMPVRSRRQRRQSAPPHGSSPARRSGSAKARDRTAAPRSSDPDATDANSSADAAPAPIPMRTICTMPQLSRSIGSG